MLAVVSPAKKLDFETPAPEMPVTQPVFLDDAVELVAVAQKKTRRDLMNLMHISEELAELNVQRFAHFSTPFNRDNAKPAVYAFRGDTYIGLDADNLTPDDLDWAEDHFRMLSGLYGVLKPRDLMQAYRLEMGTRLENSRGKNLYEFWGDKIARHLNDITLEHKNRTLVNLASNEYFKAVKTKLIEGPVITPVFKEIKGNTAKVIGFSAKRARGMMSRFMIKNRIEAPEDLKSFDMDGYVYRDDLTQGNDWVFTRTHE
ncbi:peroxide stress protein YaaA [uncultured Thalassospira sp.]|uniref:peroxide stress protein YaaA n=1 Tax=uncultured Thalassospira sp. TaxID=404382 RepID=UPI0030D82A54|tara:strand:+ start:17307 stop:18080 length:774 start_codon:yes stop_codon:yes gene_type:complete